MKHPSAYCWTRVDEGIEEKDIQQGREKRSNMLDVNKEMSQQKVRPYISYAEALGDLPTGLNKALVHWGSLRSQGHKTRLLCCSSRITNTLSLLTPCPPKLSSISHFQWQAQSLTVGTFLFYCFMHISNLHRKGDWKLKIKKKYCKKKNFSLHILHSIHLSHYV